MAGVDDPQYLSAHVATEKGILTVDVLSIRGELWLVPEWLEWPDIQMQSPAVAIRLDLVPHQRTGIGGVDITVNASIPQAVLDGLVQPSEAAPWVVIHGPSDHFGKLPMRQVH